MKDFLAYVAEDIIHNFAPQKEKEQIHEIDFQIVTYISGSKR